MVNLRFPFHEICVQKQWGHEIDIFVPGVAQGSEDAGSDQDFILLFFWCKSGELIGRGSPRFPYVTPVVESFSSDALRAT